MDLLHNLLLGWQTALTWTNLSYALIGCLLGMLVGVLRGLGPLPAIAMLLPAIHAVDATPALIMLAGVYYGAQYGGSLSAILVNVPGASPETASDGYQLARQGRAGAALSVGGLGSLFAGCVGAAIIAAIVPPLTELAFKFGPAEYFSLMVLGLIGAVVLASGSLIKAIAMIILGLLLGQINTDAFSGTPRYRFDIPELTGGINFIVIAMGLFGFGEVIARLGSPAEHREVFSRRVKGLWLTRSDFKEAWPAAVRGTGLGSLLGMLPGGGSLLASFASYSLEKKLAREPQKFGRGAVQGVAGPESANNAGAHTSFIPMLTLGIPPNAVMALMVGAMAIKGIQPGPQLMSSHPALFWGLICSMWIGNLMLVLLNVPLIGAWIKLLTVPYRFLFPGLVVLSCIGVYALRNDTFDVYMSALFALMGYVFHKLKCEPAPLMLGFILGPMMEENLRRALQMSNGDWSTFATRPVSAGLLLVAAALVTTVVILPGISGRRSAAFQEAD